MPYRLKKTLYLLSLVLIGMVITFLTGLPLVRVGESADPMSFYEMQILNLIGKKEVDVLPAQLDWNETQHRHSAVLLTRYLRHFNTGFKEKDRSKLSHYIVRLARRYKFNPYFIAAFIQVESSFNNYAISPAGAMGLMQLRPFVAESIAEELGLPWNGDETLFDPYFNLEAGVHYLFKLRKSFQNQVVPLITAYNYGPNHIAERARLDRDLPETYYRKVARVLSRIEKQVGRFPA